MRSHDIACEVCGAVIGKAIPYSYTYGEKDYSDGDEEYFEGGECEICGRVLCADCGDFDWKGVCADCAEEEEEEAV
jgi:hypothetical protein